MSNTKQQSGGLGNWFPLLVMIGALIISELFFHLVCGADSNFDAEGHPLNGNMLGTVYKGGFIVPFLFTCVLVVIIFGIERFIMLNAAQGKGDLAGFVRKLQSLLSSEKIEEAIKECDNQKGSLANVVRSGLVKYNQIKNDTHKNKEDKVEEMKTVLEEQTALELPSLGKHMTIISTIVSVGVLIGLIGTVFGMIKAFAAMSGGTPDTSQLAVGISEALINTATGITASTLGIFFYNYFNSQIDELTYRMDEASFTLVQTLSSKSDNVNLNK